MLFKNINSKFGESCKERNEYCKVFAGCIFNELIPGNSLPLLFFDKLYEKYKITCNEFELNMDDRVNTVLNNLKEDFTAENIQLCFDYHINQHSNESDNGELADIFIIGSKNFVCIEAKFEEPWYMKPDIINNLSRIKTASKTSPKMIPLQVLLIKGQKWFNQKQREDSLFYELKNYIRDNREVDFIVLLWEDLVAILKKGFPEVAEYLIEMLGYSTNWSDIAGCEFASKDFLSVFDQMNRINYTPKNRTLSIAWCEYEQKLCDLGTKNFCSYRKHI